MLDKSLLAAGAAAGTGILVGGAMVATRFAIAEVEPSTLAWLRYAIGAAVLIPVTLGLARTRFEARDLPAISLLGIGQFGILIVLLNYGMQTVPSGRGALIFGTFPLVTMVLAALLGRERLTYAKSAGVLLTITGVAAALGPKLMQSSAGEGWHGEMAIFASAIVGAACSIYYRPYVEKYPAVAVSTVAMIASVVFLSLPAWLEGFFAGAPDFTVGAWAAIVFIGLNSGLGYFLWLWALRHATPTRVTMFLSLSPVTAMGLGALLLGEPVTVPYLIGLALVVGGLALALRSAPSESGISTG